MHVNLKEKSGRDSRDHVTPGLVYFATLDYLTATAGEKLLHKLAAARHSYS